MTATPVCYPWHEMMERRSDLIYDVGLFDGGDMAYYLFRGYNVVAIDANPLMIENARVRFAKEIEARRLTLLNVGIAEKPGVATFWTSGMPEWSSFNKAIASRNGTACQGVSVPMVPFSELLATYGVPYYLKIDIEGNDQLCVDALSPATIPRFISVEAECIDDDTMLSDEEAVAMLKILRDVGYVKFKLVDQARKWRALRPNLIANLFKLVTYSASHGRLQVRGLSGITDRFADTAQLAELGFVFPPGSSGPWGDDIPGGWMTFEKARSAYLRERRAFRILRRFAAKGGKNVRELYSFWYDWHATY